MAQPTRLESTAEISLAQLGHETCIQITEYVEQSRRPSDSTSQTAIVGLPLNCTASGQKLAGRWVEQPQNKERLAQACGIEVKDLKLGDVEIGAFYLPKFTKSESLPLASVNSTLVIIAAGDLGKKNGMFRVANTAKPHELKSGEDLMISDLIGLYRSEGEGWGGTGLVLKVKHQYKGGAS